MKKLSYMVRYALGSTILRYVLVLVAGVAIVGFLDENSVWNHIRNRHTIERLQAEINRYRQQHEHDKQQLRMLDTHPKAIEKIARERYFMKKADEDIFVLSDDLQNTNQ